MAQNNQVLPSKEQTLFRHLVQNYESKQYKKGLKAAEQILRKHPNHGDTQAMKALILSAQGKSDEAFELCRAALKNAMKSHVCWHVYGLLYRGQRNYEEALKAYRFALKLDPDSVQIQRDLAMLQIQMRDYEGYVQSRRAMLTARPGFRQNWTALAIALHLSGDLVGAEDVLHRYEETLRQQPSRSDMEHADAVLYKNMIIAERGDHEKALEHINSIMRTALDKTAVMEMRAEYLLKLDRKEEAKEAYTKLLKRNPEHRAYYEGLERALGLDRSNGDDHEKLGEMYHGWAMQSDRIDAARRIPLDFKQGDAFRSHADKYLRRMFKKGVPSTFANMKQLYSEPAKKAAVQELVEGYLSEEPQVNGGAEKTEETNGSVDGSHKAEAKPKTDPSITWQISVNYYLAQHYNYYLCRDLAKAEQYIDKTISLNPSKTDYTYHMTRARILKHRGNVSSASTAMNEAREMDLKDRYINTKCAKYQLRNHQHTDAISTMGLFTRKEAVGGPLGDLLDMQCVWFITEDGESHLRQNHLALALKRFRAVYDIFVAWEDDQFDFHSFSLRKGMIRAYVDMIRWEDRLREHPFFTRAALSAVRILCMLHDNPELAKGNLQNGESAENAAERKKAAKKAKREAEKAAEAEKKAKAEKATAKADEGGEVKKEDVDPEGKEGLKVAAEKPLEEAMKYLQPLLELSGGHVDGQIAGFEVYFRRKKYLPALRCLLAAQRIDPEHPKSHEQSLKLRHALGNLSEPLPEKAKQVTDSEFLSKQPKDQSIEAVNEEYLAKHKDSASHIHAAVRVRQVLQPESADAKARSVEDLVQSLRCENIMLRQAEDGLAVLLELGVEVEAREKYVQAARERWPEATVFGAR
ncbi:hypothetical protein BAUCODRAFT_29060 [Baudoinia panamericana UAMH 10762]|uniref:Uncharacterized protein n=1 Tax=Baudoinia panamericana (strain UAMH 10762) TaxID=717646 RepID=M2MUT2_BAUPA|nr:uncharacterized protein BAUCODRAFT_29060 [Baudoinia panamericana UAMH 10762]EMD00702.1 hypothetical protein BAUCODRAFT_29060 [Baudoinia panamericana UAMH 10762]